MTCAYVIEKKVTEYFLGVSVLRPYFPRTQILWKASLPEKKG